MFVNPSTTGRVPRRRPGLQLRHVTWETPRVLSTPVTVLAHQGGWDEILMVLTPIAVFALLLKLANSRANKAQASAAERQAAADDSGGPDE
jgi:mannose/fructose/N-acetylgalactosamine-specific phosphotransferase system component IIC